MSISKAALTFALLMAPLPLFVGCESTAEAVQHQEASLSTLGFVAVPANTPVRQQMLAKLPPSKFLRRSHGNTVSYIYADPLDCHCLYVGSAKAYAQYRQLQQLRVAVKEIRADAFADQMAEADYDAPGWDWGPWGSLGSEFAPGLGW